MEQQSPLEGTTGPDLTQDVADFQRKFDQHYDGPPRLLDDQTLEFRINFMIEEIQEYCAAVDEDYMEGQLDGLVDLVYVAIGTALLHGFDFKEAWRRVHERNMQKVKVAKASDSKRGYAFDIVKPEGWTAPDLSDLVKP